MQKSIQKEQLLLRIQKGLPLTGIYKNYNSLYNHLSLLKKVDGKQNVPGGHWVICDSKEAKEVLKLYGLS